MRLTFVVELPNLLVSLKTTVPTDYWCSFDQLASKRNANVVLIHRLQLQIAFFANADFLNEKTRPRRFFQGRAAVISRLMRK
jgi:hypothetical protein